MMRRANQNNKFNNPSKGTNRKLLNFAIFSPIVKFLIFAAIFCLVITINAFSESNMKKDNETLLFLGNENLAPMVYTENGVTKGIAVDIAKALGEKMGRTLKVNAMNWDEAQEFVSQGNADALIQINETEERKIIYDFSNPLLESKFSIFAINENSTISGIDDLKGLRVGVEQKSFPENYLKNKVSIQLVRTSSILEAFKLLKDRKIDVVIVDEWVGKYTLATNNIKDVIIVGNPIVTLQSSIAVRKGNEQLLAAINNGLREIRKDGTYDRILKKWAPAEVVFQTKHQIEVQKYQTIIAVMILFILLTTIWLILLLRQFSKSRKMEKLLAIEHRRLADIIYGTDAGTWELNTEEGDVIQNERLAEIIGYAPEEVSPISIEKWISFLHPEDIIRSYHQLNRVFNKELDIYDLECRLKHKDGRWIWVHTRGRVAYWNSDGKPLLISGITSEITERKQIEYALKESEKNFREITENISEVIWIRDTEKIVYISPAYEKIWGKTCQSLYDNPDTFIESIHTDDKERITEAHLNQSLKTENIIDVQYRIVRQDGTVRWIWSRTFPIRGDNGEVIRWVGIVDDITRIKEYEETLKHAKEEAELANKAKGQFLANMSHEIRTPMNGIMGMTQLLELTNLTYDQISMVNTISTSSNMLLEIINDILDLSKIDAGKVELHPECVDFMGILNEKVQMFKVLSGNKRLDFDLRIGNDVPREIIVDNTRLIQVINNLVGNAIKFTERGKVSLYITKVKEIGSKIQLMFSISDTGVGIKEEDIPKLFESFTQLDSTTTKSFQGTGLGLAISKRLVELMGGGIGIESEYGKGSTFYFTCLAAIPQNKEETFNEENEFILKESNSKKKILLVEDDFVSQLIMKRICQKKGWDFETASNGKEALEKYEEGSYDLIVMDIQMPGMSGFEVAKIIREQEKTSCEHIPIIATTAYAMSGDREKCIEVGMDYYLSKPIDFTKFIEAIENY